jgi:hypothetical protein
MFSPQNIYVVFTIWVLLLFCFISVYGSDGVQTLSDVLLFASHPDPQLRGITSTVIGYLLQSALAQSGGNFHKWVEAECKWHFGINKISVPELMKLLLKVSVTLMEMTLIRIFMFHVRQVGARVA